MAQSRYIEIRAGDTWISVSTEFGNWLKERKQAEDFGWSEGDTLEINESLKLFCFQFPDKHGEKIQRFSLWAESTDRLYGIKKGRDVTFPNNPSLNVILPQEKEVEVPPWLK